MSDSLKAFLKNIYTHLKHKLLDLSYWAIKLGLVHFIKTPLLINKTRYQHIYGSCYGSIAIAIFPIM